jgi:hypothetical protein
VEVFGVSKYPELDGLKDDEYRRAWNKLHPEEMRQARRRFYKSHPGYTSVSNARYRLKHGILPKTKMNDRSIQKANFRYKRWDEVSDELIMRRACPNGEGDYAYSESELAAKLGRSLIGIQRRRHRLRTIEGAA